MYIGKIGESDLLLNLHYVVFYCQNKATPTLVAQAAERNITENKNIGSVLLLYFET